MCDTLNKSTKINNIYYNYNIGRSCSDRKAHVTWQMKSFKKKFLCQKSHNRSVYLHLKKYGRRLRLYQGKLIVKDFLLLFTFCFNFEELKICKNRPTSFTMNAYFEITVIETSMNIGS